LHFGSAGFVLVRYCRKKCKKRKKKQAHIKTRENKINHFMHLEPK